jgi:hypothetical protein
MRIVPGTYRDPKQVVEEIKQRLGEPTRQYTDFTALSSRVLPFAVVAAICSVPLAALQSLTTWLVSLCLGMCVGVYLLRKQMGPVEARRGMWGTLPILCFWVSGVALAVGTVLAERCKELLVGIFFPATVVSGLVTGSLGLFVLANLVVARRAR